MIHRGGAIGLLWLMTATAHSQAPRVTSAGDPSVKSDTIYALAVDPRRYADQPFVYLLDDGIVRFEANGSGSETYRQVVQILTPEAVKRWAEARLVYAPPWERLTVNWVRVLDSAGHLIETPPPHVQESHAEGVRRGATSASSMVRRLSLAGVTPGTILDISWTVEIVKPFIYGDYYAGWRVVNGQQTQRSRFLIDLPMNADIQISEQHVDFKRSETFAGGRQVYVWAASDIKKPDPELFAPDSSTGVRVAVAVARPWIDVSKLWARYSAHHYELDSASAAQIVVALRGAATRDDTLRRIFRWAARESRCDPVDPPAGSHEYRLCDDRPSLFIAAARSLGFNSYPVLLGVAAPVDTAFPSLQQLDHLIAAVERSEDNFEFGDLDARGSRFGDLPIYDQGKFGLLIRDDGTHDKVRLPEVPPAGNRLKVSFTGELDAAGTFTGQWSSVSTGVARHGIDSLMTSGLLPDSSSRANCARSFTDSMRAKAFADKLPRTDATERPDEERIVMHACASRIITDAGAIKMLELPLIDLSNRRLVATLEARQPRHMPIDAAKVAGAFEFDEELELTMPPTWRARLPGNVVATSAFGSYEATYAQVGRQLRITRRYTGSRGVYPASRYDELLTWLRAKAADDVKVLIIDP